MTHRSFGKTNNERLEFIGDAALDLIIAEVLYLKYPELPEGQLSHMRSLLVKGEALAELSLKCGLGHFIKLGQGERKTGGHLRPSILADAFEALIGAVYLDGGFEACKALVLKLFNDKLSCIDQKREAKDAKTALQEYLQSKKMKLPEYALVKSAGKQHQQIFTMSCSIAELQVTVESSGASKKLAEQKAAQLMLDRLVSE